MALRRKKHGHPSLTPPRSIWKESVDKGNWFKEKIGYQENDHGAVINGRAYGYHPTKGWRNRHTKPSSFNLTQYLVLYGRKA